MHDGKSYNNACSCIKLFQTQNTMNLTLYILLFFLQYVNRQDIEDKKKKILVSQTMRNAKIKL